MFITTLLHGPLIILECVFLSLLEVHTLKYINPSFVWPNQLASNSHKLSNNTYESWLKVINTLLPNNKIITFVQYYLLVLSFIILPSQNNTYSTFSVTTMITQLIKLWYKLIFDNKYNIKLILNQINCVQHSHWW